MTRLYLFLGGLAGGGAQRQFLQLTRAARRRGHEVRLGTVHPGGRFWEEASGTGCVEALWPNRAQSTLTRAWRLAGAFWRLRRSVRAFETDVLYSALYPANFVAWLATRMEGSPPLVWGIRASDVPARWPRELWIRLGAAVSTDVDLAIANSEAGRSHHRRRGYRPESWAVVRNGIDTDRFRPDPDGRRRVRHEWGLADEQPLVGLVGRLAPMKGHEDFLSAASRVRKKRPDARFVCVGSGPPDDIRTLKGRAEELHLGGVIRWAGERRDMPAVYSALDLLVLASRSGEGFPNVVGEAMACGTPCVVTAVGDAPEIVGPLGEVVPRERPDLLAHAIVDSLGVEGSEGRDGAGPRAGGSSRSTVALRDRIVRRFSLDRCVNRTLELLDRVAEGRGRGDREEDGPS